ncbi:MAG: hypothetical protein KatS3mg057_2210 [Herpetosiphonaceae bacterium]|nr:MAG: hypothetical protein KatS3mg057_2210 [Herpetosiphonaceae bacterium]
MPQHTTVAPPTPPLLARLLALVESHRPAFRQQRTFHRATALLVGMLGASARHTLTQALIALGLIDIDWSAFYRLFSRARIDLPTLQHQLFASTLANAPADQPYVVAVDGVAFPRTSRRMPGVGWRKAPNTAPFRAGLALAQRFCILHWLPALEQGWTRAIALICLPCFTPKARPAAAPPMREWEAALQALQTLRVALDTAGRPRQWIVVLADGSYDVVELWRALPHHTALLARTARNRALRQLPPPSTARGRRRLYGDQAPTPAQWLQQRRGWQETSQVVRGHPRRLRYRIEGPYLRQRAPLHPLWLVLMGGEHYRRHGREKRRDPVPVLVSAIATADGGWALPLPVEAFLVWLWQRWEVEVAHRELKSGFGVGAMPCWHREGTIRSVQWGVWAYGVCLLAAYQSWGICGGPRAPGRWWRGAQRWSFRTVWRSLRAAWWHGPAFQARQPRTPSDWAKKEAWLGAMLKRIAGSTRLEAGGSSDPPCPWPVRSWSKEPKSRIGLLPREQADRFVHELCVSRCSRRLAGSRGAGRWCRRR